jgi:hypothetical protein
VDIESIAGIVLPPKLELAEPQAGQLERDTEDAADKEDQSPKHIVDNGDEPQQ